MYQDRRFRNMPPDFYVDEQLAKWRWDSHLWGGKPLGDGVTQMQCVWCKWLPPAEMPLDHAPLCTENPVIKAHLLKAVGDGITKVMDGLKGGG